MESAFLDFFKRFTFLSFEDLKQLYTLVKIRKYPKDYCLVQEGAVSRKLYLVLKGIVRSYFLRPDGSEITVHLAIDGMESASPHTIFRGEPSHVNIETVETSLLLEIDFEKFDALAGKFSAINRIKTERLIHTLVDAADRIEFYTVLSPEERFLDVQQKHPDLIQRVPQKYLASYIGVTPISLSRIKARLAYAKK